MSASSVTSADLRAAALVVILRRRLVPAGQLAEAARRHGGPIELFRALTAATELFPSPDAAHDPDAALADAAEEIRGWRARGIDVLSDGDDDYPRNLRSVGGRPPLLLVRGALQPGDARSVAVIGTRQPSDDGLRHARRFAGRLAELGYVVVSGLALGIDTIAHTAALEVGGRTLAVIGTGLDHAYPPANASLQAHLGRTSAVLSQFWPQQGPRPWTFPMRNAVMAGVALATVVVEASSTSGARIQAGLALAQGRPLFLLRSLVEQEAWAATCARRSGVHVVATGDDLVSRLEPLSRSA